MRLTNEVAGIFPMNHGAMASVRGCAMVVRVFGSGLGGRRSGWGRRPPILVWREGACGTGAGGAAWGDAV